QRQRMADERAGEIRHANGRYRIVAELPVAAVQRVHVLALAGDYANRIAATDHLAVRAQVGLDAEQTLRAGRVRTEAGHDLVEDQQRAGFPGYLAQFAQELHGLEIRAPALHGLHQHRGDLVRALADDLHRLGRAVVEYQHVLGGVAQDARRRRHRAQLAGASHDHLVDDAVV